MTKEELKKLIDLKRKEISVSYEKPDAYYYLKEFYDNNNCNKAADFLEIDVCKFIKCLYFVKAKDKSIEECKKTIGSFLNYFINKYDEEDLDNFMNMCLTFHSDGVLPKIIEYYEENRLIKSNLIFKSIYPNNKRYRKLIEHLKKDNDFHDGAVLEFFKFLLADYDMCLELMSFVKAIKVMETIEEDLDMMLGDLDYSVKEKERNRELNARLKKYLYMNKLFSDFNKIGKFVNNVETFEIHYNKNQARELSGLDIAERLLFSALDSDKEITNARQIVKTVKNEELKCDFLRVIYDYNMKEYEKLEKEYDALSKNTKVEYQALLGDYGISVDDNLFSLIRQNSLEDVQEILKIISNFSIGEKDIIRILVNANLESMIIVKNYVDAGILSNDFLQNNIDVFYTDSVKRNLLEENMKILNSYGVNPGLFKNSVNILLADSKALKKGMAILFEYYLVKSIRNIREYNFILDDELSSKIDKFIELGYENSLEENLSLLNSDKIKRLEVLKAMGMTGLSTVEIEKVLNESFFIKDSELDDYIPSVVKYKDKIAMGDSNSLLNGYRSGFRTYDINGVLISSNKVTRLLNEGYDLYVALFSNLNLSEDEYNSVLEGLSQKKIIKKVGDGSE